MMFSQNFVNDPIDIEFLGDEGLEMDDNFEMYLENQNQQKEN